MPEPTHSELRLAKTRELLALLPPQKRAATAAALKQKDKRCLQTLTDLIHEEERARTRFSARVVVIVVLAIVGVLFISPALAGVLLLGAIIALGCSSAPRTSTVREQKALELLALDTDRASLGILLERGNAQGGYLPVDVRRKVFTTLTALLQSIREEDAPLLGAYERAQLYGTVQNTMSTTLCKRRSCAPPSASATSRR